MAIASAGVGNDSLFVRGLVGLYVWKKVSRSTEEELSDAEASIIETLWRDAGRKVKITSGDASVLVNAARAAEGLSPLAPVEFDQALARLDDIRCVEIENGVIWLREWVRRKT